MYSLKLTSIFILLITIGCINNDIKAPTHGVKKVNGVFDFAGGNINTDITTEVSTADTKIKTKAINTPVFTEATFFESTYKYWSKDAIIPKKETYNSNYDPNLSVCSTISSIPLGSLIEVSFEDSERKTRTVNVVVTENNVLVDKNIGIVMERTAYSQLFEYNDGYLPSNFAKVSYIILDNLK